MNGCNYQVGYDLLETNIAEGWHKLRTYGVLNVTNNYIAWSRGTARVWNTTVWLETYYGKGSYTLVSEDIKVYCDENGDSSVYIGGSLNTTFVSSGEVGGIATLPHIDRSKSEIVSYTLGPSVRDPISVTYTSTPGKEKRLRISIPNVVMIKTISDYSNGQTVYLTNSDINLIKQYTSQSTVPIGLVIETWSGNQKVGETYEPTVQCSFGSTVRIGINGQWKEATPYIGVNGQWKEATPYIGVNGQWKEGI